MDQNKTLTSSKAVIFLTALALLALAFFLFVKGWGLVREAHQVRLDGPSITVSGTGKVSTPPTIAEVVFTVDERAPIQKDAQAQATKKVDGALSALNKLEIAEKDIQATGYQVMPQYENKNCKVGYPCTQGNTVTGYQVTETVTVKIRDIGKSGDVMKALADAGVQNISGPNYRVDDPTEAQAEARGKAIADAHEKAVALAKQLGVSLGGVIGFSENNGAFPMYQGMMAKSADVAGAPVGAPSLPQGETETSVTVNVSYEIR